MKNKLENEKELEEEAEEKPFADFIFTALKIFTALVVLIGMIYISGLKEYLFFRKTSSDLTLNNLESTINWEEIKVPIRTILIREPSLGTERNSKEFNSLIQNTQSIMNQAGIVLIEEEIVEIKLSKEEVSRIMDGNFLILDDNLSKKKVNIVLVKTLGGINGVAYPSKKIVILSDYTAGYDFRTLAHELGHIFSLGHIEDHKRVMTQGKSGLLFSKEEIIKMRKTINEEF